jgi:peptidoglycan hydrolase-like protein with peptidoglycan-binding domain
MTPPAKAPLAHTPAVHAAAASAQARAAPVRPTPTRISAPAASPNVQQAQIVLTRLGYYAGPADGQANEAYKVALFRYQKDQRDQSAGPKPYLPNRDLAER